MIGKCENFISNSSLEATWVYRFIVCSFGLQLLLALISSIFGITFTKANFYITEGFSNKGTQIFYALFFEIFLISVIKEKGFSSIIKSGIRFLFFLLMTNSLIFNTFSAAVVPQKYDDIENYILIEEPEQKKNLKITFIEKLLKKILGN
jgi:hypothetical protein